MSFRIKILPLVALLLLAILYVPSSVPGTAPCSQLASGAKHVFLGFLVPSAAACPGPEFTVTANPSSLTINPGATGTSTIALTSLYGFSGTVSLSTSPSPLCPSPNCSTWSINPTSVTLPPNGTAASTLTITAGTSSPTPGNGVNVTVSGTSGNLTRSAIVKFTTSSTPDFTLSAYPNPQTTQPGATATYTLLVTSINGFSGTVSLQTPLVPCSTYCWNVNPTVVNVPAGGNATSILIITTTTGIKPGNYQFTVFGFSGGLSHQVTAYFNVVSSTPDFSITANPASLQVQTGTTGTSTVAVTSLHGFAGNVSLRVPPSPMCPACTSWAINPWTVTLSSNETATSTLTIYAGGNPTSGSVTVNATSGNLSHTVTVSYTILSTSSDFTISATPSSLGIPAGTCATSTVTAKSVNSFNGTVTLTSSSSPTGLSPTLGQSSLVVPAGGSATTTLTVCTTPSTPSGSYSITVTATSGTLSHVATVSVTVTAPNFSISASTGNITIDQGSSGTSTINVTSLNGFAGTISLSVSISPSGPTGVINPSNITLQGGGTADSVVTVSTTAATPQGSYVVTVTATSGSITHTVTIGVRLVDPPGSGGGGGGKAIPT